MNFAHLASFQAIEFMDWPVPKALNIFVYVRQVKTKLSLQSQLSIHEEREHKFISSPVSTLFVGSA